MIFKIALFFIGLLETSVFVWFVYNIYVYCNNYIKAEKDKKFLIDIAPIKFSYSASDGFGYCFGYSIAALAASLFWFVTGPILLAYVGLEFARRNYALKKRLAECEGKKDGVD